MRSNGVSDSIILLSECELPALDILLPNFGRIYCGASGFMLTRSFLFSASILVFNSAAGELKYCIRSFFNSGSYF